MKLWYSKTSPYARKALILIKYHQLEQKVELLQTTQAFNSNAPHNIDNPLGRVPALYTTDNGWLYGSYLISEYLDLIGNKHPLIPQNSDRWKILAIHALADGILENVMPIVAERMMRPQDQWWDDRHAQLLERSIKSFKILEEKILKLGYDLNIGTLTTVSLIDWWELRNNVIGISLSSTFPRLVQWAKEMNHNYHVLSETWAPLD